MATKVKIKKLQWSEETQPNDYCRYNHVLSQTPFGNFLITWKGWKKYDSPTIDETPWGGFLDAFLNVEQAKEAAEKEYIERIKQCLEAVKP